MLVQLDDHERRFLLELLEHKHKESLHELHHTATADFKRLVSERIELLEALAAKLTETPAVR